MANLIDVPNRLRRSGDRIRKRYSAGYDRPLRAYSAVLGGYAGLVVRLPDRFTVQDVVMSCLATHKASRLLSKEAVTSPLRAPFTTYEEAAGEAEVNESVRDR